jgi:hypothetical protein
MVSSQHLMLAEVRDENVVSKNRTGCITRILAKISVTSGASSRRRRWRYGLCSRQCYCSCRRHAYDLTQLYSHVKLEVVNRGLFRPPILS